MIRRHKASSSSDRGTNHQVLTGIEEGTGRCLFSFSPSLADLMGLQWCVWLALEDIRSGVDARAEALARVSTKD